MFAARHGAAGARTQLGRPVDLERPVRLGRDVERAVAASERGGLDARRFTARLEARGLVAVVAAGFLRRKVRLQAAADLAKFMAGNKNT